MADIIPSARPDRDDDDFRLVLSTLTLTAPHLTRAQLGEVADLARALLQERLTRPRTSSVMNLHKLDS